MATIKNQPDGGSIGATTITHPSQATIGAVAPKVRTTPETYTSLGDLVGLYAKPDNRDLLIKTYGDQGITGFLQLTGAVNAAATQDEVVYWEEGRRHALAEVTLTNADGDHMDLAADAQPIRDNDVLMGKSSGKRYLVKMTSDASTAALSEGGSSFAADLFTLDGSDADTNDTTMIIIGNLYEQGSVQPTAYMEPELIRRVNPFMIIKEKYKVNGSQATNIGWVNIGNGEYRWYLKGEQETRDRFNDKREMMMLFGQTGNTESTVKLTGSEGYFAAIEDRGIVVSNAAASPLDSIAEFDDIILQLDKEGAPAEYAMYLNRKQSLAIDDMLASGIATNVTAGLAGQFGAFNNDSDLAVQLGFKSFTRGGYTFHKHDWKLLNDPNLLGATDKFQGAMVPMATVADPRTGNRAPALEMNYKAANGYSREMEHWVTGGGVLGHFNNGDSGEDSATFHYRSEINLITRAANQHVAIKG
tara:strand:- start:33 stop:1451 length:1419 start_codon:yes stop_codon:yes gene_type:complete